jgi:hypothetical protein
LRYPATLLPLLENAVVGAQGDLARELQERADAHNAGNDDSQSQSQSQLPDGSNSHERTQISLPPMMVKGCKSDGNGSAATRVHARLVHLPPTCCKTSLGSMQAEDVGKVFQVSTVGAGQCMSRRDHTGSWLTDLPARYGTTNNDRRFPLRSGGNERCQFVQIQRSKRFCTSTIKKSRFKPQ